MPDVIIKGMEVPSGCRACKLNNDTICALINGCVYDETDGSTRRPDCPLRPAPVWISVEERLPYYGQKCLVVSKLYSHNDARVSISYCYVQKEGFWSDTGRDWHVTHWMPLPEPADGGDGDG